MNKTKWLSAVLVLMLLAGRAWAIPEELRVECSVGEEEIKGKNVQLLKIAFSEAVVQDRVFTRSDLEKEKWKCLRMKPPLLFGADGQPFPFKFIGREVRQDAANNQLINRTTFKYKHAALAQWQLKDPLLVHYAGKIYHTRPAGEEEGIEKPIEVEETAAAGPVDVPVQTSLPAQPADAAPAAPATPVSAAAPASAAAAAPVSPSE